jgi:hypothetical protein
MTITLITSSYRRPDILRLYLEGIERLKDQCSVKFNSVISGDNADIIKSYGSIHVPCADHTPLTTRFNLSCAVAKETNPDWIVIMGSDDLMNKQTIDYVLTNSDKDYINPRVIYFYCVSNDYKGEMIYILTSHIGCCRFIRRDLIEKMGWVLCPDKDYGLDQHISRHIEKYQVNPHLFTGRNYGAICIDVKDSESKNGFHKWKRSTRVDPNPVLEFLSDKEKQILNKILNK